MGLLHSSGPQLCGEPTCSAPAWPPLWWLHAAKLLGRNDGPNVPRCLLQGVGGVFLPTHLWAKEPTFFFWRGAWALVKMLPVISAAPTLTCRSGDIVISFLSPCISQTFGGCSSLQVTAVRAFGQSGFSEPSPVLLLLRPLYFPVSTAEELLILYFPRQDTRRSSRVGKALVYFPIP